MLEQKIKQEKRKRIIKRLSYAAILLPFIFAIWEIIQFQNQGTTPTEYSSIAPGSSRAILTIGKDKTIYIERDSNINIHKIDSNVFIQHNTLQYKMCIRDSSDFHFLYLTLQFKSIIKEVMRIDILSVVPELLVSPLNHSIIKRAQMCIRDRFDTGRRLA